MKLMWAVLACGLTLSAPVAAEPTDEQKQEVARRVEELKTRLKLTPEQEEKLGPLVKEEVQKLKAIREKHQGASTRSEKRQMLQEMRPVQQHFRAEVEKILTPEQMAEWKKIRDERKEEMKERAKAKSKG
jgi:hypothetical protein